MSDVQRRRERDGWNELPEKRVSAVKLFLKQFQDVSVYILLGAVLVSVLLPFLDEGVLRREDYFNAAVILTIVFLNAILGFSQEKKADNAIALLKKLSAPSARVLREGQVLIIPSRELVTGDIMLIEAGDMISADARVLLPSSLEVNESSLTGESMPVAKLAYAKGEEDASGSTVYAGTVVTRGSAEAEVTGIGLLTEIGKVASLVASTVAPPTPLQVKLKQVTARVGLLVTTLCGLLFAVGLSRGMPIQEVFFIVVTLAVAAVPEGLPAIVTICLALGVQRMIRRRALIRRLDAIETLGSITVICADKTGTMTANRMEVSQVLTVSGVDEHLLIQIAASCNRAPSAVLGDPTETALVSYAEKKKIDRLPILEEEVPFTSEEKYMVTVHERSGQLVRFFKGAPEVIGRLANVTNLEVIFSQTESMAGRGLRVLACARDQGKGIEFAGLLGLLDPPREGVREAIGSAKKAGIRTIMITGDNPVTAASIASHVGIPSKRVLTGLELDALSLEQLQAALESVSIFARVSPTHKVKILSALQAKGEVVAMSGDGVNDAPALKKAHVGIAMGRRGTDVARDAAAMVLTDDNYATIVSAIREGRRIYDNIRKFIIFLFRTNLGELMIVSTSLLLNFPLPLLPLHILWINLVTDSLPALALAAERGEANVMSRPPRPLGENILRGELTLMIIAATLNTILVLSLFSWILARFGSDLTLARTAAFNATIIFQLLLAFSSRVRRTLFSTSPAGNPWLIVAVATSFGLQLMLFFTPLQTIFHITPLPQVIWIAIFALSFVALLLFECAKGVRNRFAK